MIQEFGQHVRQVRQLRGLRIVDVVRLLGVGNQRNEAKPIRALTKLEQSGDCTPQFFWQIAEVLHLDPEKLAQLAQEHEEKWQRALDAPCTAYLVWSQQCGPTRFGVIQRVQFLPTGTNLPQALAVASRFARVNQVEVRLHVSRRQCVIIDQAGAIRRVERLTIGVGLAAFTVNGQQFRLQRLKP